VVAEKENTLRELQNLIESPPAERLVALEVLNRLQATVYKFLANDLLTATQRGELEQARVQLAALEARWEEILPAGDTQVVDEQMAETEIDETETQPEPGEFDEDEDLTAEADAVLNAGQTQGDLPLPRRGRAARAPSGGAPRVVRAARPPGATAVACDCSMCSVAHGLRCGRHDSNFHARHRILLLSWYLHVNLMFYLCNPPPGFSTLIMVLGQLLFHAQKVGTHAFCMLPAIRCMNES
jgi:hypothetical protein